MRRTRRLPRSSPNSRPLADRPPARRGRRGRCPAIRRSRVRALADPTLRCKHDDVLTIRRVLAEHQQILGPKLKCSTIMIKLVELRCPAIRAAATRPLHSSRDAHLEPPRSLPSLARDPQLTGRIGRRGEPSSGAVHANRAFRVCQRRLPRCLWQSQSRGLGGGRRRCRFTPFEVARVS